MRILIIEDHEEIWDVLSRRLERRGFEIVRATDVQEAVDKARTEVPDVILIDAGAYAAHGWTAAQMMREDPAVAAVPIIAAPTDCPPF